MKFIKLAKERFSVRSFSNKRVPEEKIKLILEAARIAPTACNKQPIKILVLKSKNALDKLKLCTNCHFNAPLAFIICSNEDECWVRPFDKKLSGDIDASIVTTHMMLEAKDLGLGSTWVMHFDPKAVKKEFSLPKNIEPVAILPVGFPDPKYIPSKQHKSKKSIKEIIENK